MFFKLLGSLLLFLSLAMGDSFARCPVEDVQVIAGATALNGEQIQGVLYWPIVSGQGDQDAIAMMNKLMDYEIVTGESLEETLEIFGENSMFTVNYVDTDLIDITITVDFLGAYPSTFDYYFTFDAGTGERLVAGDLFLDDKIDDLVALLDLHLQRNIEIRKRQNTVVLEDDGQVTELDQDFVREDLEDFTVMPDGMIFRHDFGFLHAILALEPEGEIFLEWEILAEFANMDGPLAALITMGE